MVLVISKVGLLKIKHLKEIIAYLLQIGFKGKIDRRNFLTFIVSFSMEVFFFNFVIHDFLLIFIKFKFKYQTK